jgi:uncharacterized membrane protein
MWQIILSTFYISIISRAVEGAAQLQQQGQIPAQNVSASLQSSSAAATTTTSSSGEILGQSLEALIRPYVGYITFGIDVAAGIIIGISAIMALISFFKILREPAERQTQDKETIRLRLARGMLLALDFEVGSDILKTILIPSVNELTILAVVVGIRIVLSWSLSKEIDRHVDMKETQTGFRAFNTVDDKDMDLKNKNSTRLSENYRNPPSRGTIKENKDNSATQTDP